MMKHVKRVLVILVFLAAAAQVPVTHAQGGLVFNPYWTYETKAPVTHVETGDINGDGVPEVVILTANNLVHVLENDGNLAWLAPFVAVVLLLLGYRFWQFGLKHYNSTGT